MKYFFLDFNLKNVDNFMNLKVCDRCVIFEDIFETVDLIFDILRLFEELDVINIDRMLQEVDILEFFLIKVIQQIFVGQSAF